MKVSLFITCLGDIFYRNAGKATVELLEHLGCEIDFPKGQTCCGQPAFNSGYRKETVKLAKHMIEIFETAEYIVTPSGSCAYMVHEYEHLLHDDLEWRERAIHLKNKTYELTQFITDVMKITDVGAKFHGTATYHTSCHMTRLLGVTESPGELLSHVEGLELVNLPKKHDCCGFGGTFAVKMSDISEQMADEKVLHIESTGAHYLIGADAGCLMNIGGRMQKLGKQMEVLHIAEVLNSRGDSA